MTDVPNVQQRCNVSLDVIVVPDIRGETLNDLSSQLLPWLKHVGLHILRVDDVEVDVKK
jgi:hypothetical protein